VVSVDDLKTFKPDPEVYKYLARRLDRSMSETWLVSGSPRDVIGAKSAGLQAAWIREVPMRSSTRGASSPTSSWETWRNCPSGSGDTGAPLQRLAEKGTPDIAWTADM
jgi:beta-phosphoglucomutase-like phosphatase (HAD superfamily)